MIYYRIRVLVSKKILALIIPLLPFFGSYAQQGLVNFQLEAQAIGTSSDQVPFWFRSRQDGSLPLSGYSGSLVGYVYKDYDTTRRRTIDWGIGLEGRANGSKSETDMILVQANAKIKLAMFEIRAGRWRGQAGLTDTLLTSGAFSISGNALGLPQVQISIPEFYPLSFTNGWVALKGSFSHGWLGQVPISEFYWVNKAETYFHHKSLYGRFGKPGGVLGLYGGFTHQAFWGNEAQIFGANYDLALWESYKSVLLGQMWALSKVGNHLGSIDLGLQLNFNSVRLLAYRQFFYEAGALAHFANIEDGLNGLSLTNKRFDSSQKRLQWKKFLLEVMYSMDQAGNLSSPATPTGHESYYNHYLYSEGWSYKKVGIGTPLFTTRREAKPGQAFADQYFINNRILAFHIGLLGSWRGYQIKALATSSYNKGTYATSGKPYRVPFEQIHYPSPDLVFEPVLQFSSFLSVQRNIVKRARQKREFTPYWGGQIGFDSGKLLSTSWGGMLNYGIHF